MAGSGTETGCDLPAHPNRAAGHGSHGVLPLCGPQGKWHLHTSRRRRVFLSSFLVLLGSPTIDLPDLIFSKLVSLTAVPSDRNGLIDGAASPKVDSSKSLQTLVH